MQSRQAEHGHQIGNVASAAGSGGDGAVRRHAQLGTGMDLADAGPSHDALAAAALAPRESIDVDVAAAGAGRSPPGDAERIADGLLG